MRPKPPSLFPRRAAALAVLGATLACAGFAQEPARPGFVVKIHDEKPVVTDPEAVAAVEPVKRIQFGPAMLTAQVNSEDGRTLHLGHYPTVSVDGRLHLQGQGGRAEVANRPLPRDKGPKWREGFQSVYVYGDVRLTCTITLTPTRPTAPGAKRRLDAVLIHYLVENKGNQPHKFGLRIYMDTYVIDNDACLFAAPTRPKMILDGVVLKGKEFPDYVQLLQRPNLDNPGYVAHLTFNLGSKLEKPDRVVLTRHGAGGAGWDMQAIGGGGDSGLGFFWEPKEIKPGGKREFAYGYGKGIASSPESEGQVSVALGGSFEPGKLFTVTAYVTDPGATQNLTLELPAGMELVEGAATQAVPAPADDEARSLVLWKGRVRETGEHRLRVRSSTGVTQTKVITIARPGS
jgi:hypothetical protein